MSLLSSLAVIGLLIAICAFLAMSEISLAASRKLKLRQLADAGNPAAARVLQLQENPGAFFTVVQIGLNAVGLLGGIVGEQALSPWTSALIGLVYDGPLLGSLSFALSFLFLTSLFVLFSDLIPKRLAMLEPERYAMLMVYTMSWCVVVFRPLVWVFNGLANRIFRLLGVASVRVDEITAADIMAMANAGAETGALLRQEQHMISNVFELDSRIVPSAMTTREDIVFFTLSETEESIRQKIAAFPHGKYPVCESTIDTVIGYVDSKDILPRILHGQNLSLRTEPIVRTVLTLPDTLTLFESLEHFRDAKEDFALIVNEYALVVGLLSLQDVMSTVMGELGNPCQESLIVKRDENSWLIDGLTPIEDVMQALDIAIFEGFENYETVAGFLMYRLRKVPKRTDFVVYAGYKFEVVDIDSYRIDQVLVTREVPLVAANGHGG